MAVQQGQTELVGDEIDLHALIAAKHCNVLVHTGGGCACDVGDFEGVPVQMHGV